MKISHWLLKDCVLWLEFNHLEPWYTSCQEWFHNFHYILHIHEFIYEFISNEMSHMNSWSWNLVWIHNTNSDMSSWSWRILWNHMSWRISWNHISEFMCINSSLNSGLRIHDGEIIYEFIIMNSCWNSVLWRISWNDGWIPGNKITFSTWRFLKFPFLLTSRPSWSRRQWRPSCAYKALHVLSALLCAATIICRRSSAAGRHWAAAATQQP